MSTDTPAESSGVSPGLSHDTHPLLDFYTVMGLPLPDIESISGDQVPQPYRRLLVHERDMTPTLEQFHGETIHLKILRREKQESAYFREVVLLLDETGEPAEFGAIKIFLDRFEPRAQEWILKEYLPLGTILKRFEVEHTSRPTAFLKLQSDTFINSALQLSESHTLYGRRNTLLNPEGLPLAEIVEILPPTKRD